MEQQTLNAWYLGWTIATAVVVVVAVLVLALIMTARAILRNATRALELANEIVVNTKPIWALQDTNQVAAQLLNEARDIETHAWGIADALESNATQG